MKFAKRVFLVAGVYGVIVIVPMYFAEGRIGRDHPPAITHPEFYYGFLGVAGKSCSWCWLKTRRGIGPWSSPRCWKKSVTDRSGCFASGAQDSTRGVWLGLGGLDLCRSLCGGILSHSGGSCLIASVTGRRAWTHTVSRLASLG